MARAKGESEPPVENDLFFKDMIAYENIQLVQQIDRYEGIRPDSGQGSVQEESARKALFQRWSCLSRGSCQSLFNGSTGEIFFNQFHLAHGSSFFTNLDGMINIDQVDLF